MRRWQYRPLCLEIEEIVYTSYSLVQLNIIYTLENQLLIHD